MAVGGATGGGGRNVVRIDVITNWQQAIAHLKAVDQHLKQIGKGVGGGGAAGIQNLTQAQTNLNSAVAAGVGPIGALNRQAGVMSSTMNSSAAGAAAMSRGLHSVQQQTQATAGSMGQLSSSAQANTAQMGRLRAGYTAFRNAGRGAQFAIIGLIGSVNEAVFMIERTIAANQKVGETQAEVNRLMAEGKEGTSEYTRAVQAKEEAERGAQFTSRIMAQSVLDNVTFGGMLASQLPKVRNEYRRLRQSATEANAAMGLQGGILTRLRTQLSNLTGGLIPLPNITRTAAQNITLMGNSAAASGNALVNLAGRTTALAQGITPLSLALDRTTATIRTLGPAAASAGAATLPLATGMRTLDVTSKSIVPTLGLVTTATSSMVPANTAAAGSTVPLAAGMRAVDVTSKSILPTLGLVTTATSSMVPANLAAAGSTLPLAAGMKLVDTTSKSLVPSLWGAGAGAAGSGAGALLGAGGWGVFSRAIMAAAQASWTFIKTPLGLIITAIAGVTTALIALNQNWGGMRTGMANISQQARTLMGDFEGLWDIMAGFSPAIGFITVAEDMEEAAIKAGEGQEEAARAAEELKSKLDQLNAGLAESTAKLQGYGQGWETVLQDADSFIAEIANSFKQFGSGVEGEIAAVQQILNESLTIDPSGELYKSANARLMVLQQFRNDVHSQFDLISNVIADSTAEWGDKWAALSNEFGRMPDQLIGLPGHFKAVVDRVVNVIDTAFEADKLKPEQWGQIFTDMIDGHLTPATRRMIAELEGGQAALDQWDLTMKNVDTSGTNFKQTISAVGQGVASEGMIIEDMAEATQEADKAIREMTSAQEIAAEAAKRETDALMGLDATSRAYAQSNQDIILGIKEQTQAFDENNVAIAAQASGLQTWRDTLAQAYFSIVETATALGYMGDTSKASAAAMLEFTAAQQQINETNQQGVESFFQLSDAAKQVLDSYGLTAQMMGEVALGQKDLTESGALMIEIISGIDEANKANVEGMQQLVEAGFNMNQVIALSNEEIARYLAMLETGQLIHRASADAINEHAAAISAMHPAVQQLARALGVYSIANKDITQVTLANIQAVHEAQSQMDSLKDTALDLAKSVGMPLNEAFELAAAGGDRLIWALATQAASMEDFGEVQKSFVQQTIEEAEKYYEAWTEALEKVKSAVADSISAVGSGMEEMWKEGAKKMEVGLSDFEKEIFKGTGFLKQFWEELLPEDFLAAAITEGLDADDIYKELKDLMDDVTDKDLVDEDDMDRWVKPIKDWFKNLPDEFEEHAATIATLVPSVFDDFRRDVVAGVEVGPELRKALKENITDPMVQILQQGGGAQEAIPEFIRSIEMAIPELRNISAPLAATMEFILQSAIPPEEKVNQILAVFSGLGLDIEETLMGIDVDEDASSDLFDRLLVTPAEEAVLRAMDEMRALGILTGTWTKEQEANYRNLSGQIMNVDGATVDFSETLIGYDVATGNASLVTNSFMKSLEGLDPVERDLMIQMYELKKGVDIAGEGLTAAELAAYGAAGGLDATDTAAGNAEGGLQNAGSAAETASSQFAGLGGNLSLAEQAFDRLQQKTGRINPKDFGWATDFNKTLNEPFAIDQQQGIDEFGNVIKPSIGSIIDPYLEKLQELSDKAREVIPQIEMMWTNHFNNTTGQMTAFITGPLTQLATTYNLYHAAVTPILAAMELAWTNHLVNNGAQITAFITGPLTLLAQAYTLYQTNVVPILQAMELAWTMHLANNGAQIQAFIVGPLTLLAQAYTLYQTNVIPILQQMELAWTNHLANNGAQITAFITGPLTLLAQAYTLFQTNVVPILAQMELAWTNHLANNTAQITAFITGSLNGLINTYPLIAQAVHTNLESMNQNWGAHVTHVTGQVTGLITGPVSGYINSMSMLSEAVHSNLESANQNWAAHVSHVEGLIGEMINHVEELADAISQSMSDIASSMGEAESAAESLKSAIDALEDKTITVTTRYVTRGSPGGGGRQNAQHGFEGIISRPTRFLVGEGNEPEFVSVTPLSGRNARGNPDTREYFDRLRADREATEMAVSAKQFERAGSGGIGSSKSVKVTPTKKKKKGKSKNDGKGKSVKVTPTNNDGDGDGGGGGGSGGGGPAASGLKRPDITRAAVRRKTTLNAFFEDVLTYEEEQDYKRILKKLEKKKWKVSKLNDEDEERLNEIEDKILQARYDELQRIKQAMEQVQRQINLTVDLTSDEELEKWITTVIPPLSAAPLSMHSSAITAMSVRGRYQHHKDAMKAGRRAEIQWMEAEYERQQRLIEELEEKRLKEEQERDEWLAEHGSKKEKKEAKKRIKKRKEEQRRKLLLSRGTRRDLGYAYAIDKYYKDLAKSADPPVRKPLPPDTVESRDPATTPTNEEDISARRGFHGIVKKRTNFTVGEFGRKERVDVTPLGERFRTQAEEIRKEVRHFVSGLLAATGGLGSNISSQAGGGNVVHIRGEIDAPIEVKMFDNSTVTKRELRKLLVDGYTSYH